jgi:hypothetical protein
MHTCSELIRLFNQEDHGYTETMPPKIESRYKRMVTNLNPVRRTKFKPIQQEGN